jgi:N-acetylglucosamine-6-phosphate deacetylase|tara:strand:- start:489 stop:707 length:219 start_codon:yes stop_codon:yes gene_type:complete
VSEEEKKIILITDVIEQKLRKEKEIEFYMEELERLNQKVFWLKQEVKLTESIIDMIKRESIQTANLLPKDSE